MLGEDIDTVTVQQDINELVELVMTPPIFQDGQVIVLDYDLNALNADAEGVFGIVSIDSLSLSLSGGASFDALDGGEVALAQQIKNTQSGYTASFLLPSSAYLLDTPQSVTISAEVTIGLTGGSDPRRELSNPSQYVGQTITSTADGFASGVLEETSPSSNTSAGATLSSPMLCLSLWVWLPFCLAHMCFRYTKQNKIKKMGL